MRRTTRDGVGTVGVALVISGLYTDFLDASYLTIYM